MIGWKFVCGLAVAALTILLAPSTTWAQIRDQVVVYASTGEVSEPVVMCRYSRNLQLLGTTGTAGEVWETLGASNPMAVDGAGNYWICAGPLSGTKLIRIDRDGALLPSAVLGHNPVAITATSSGTMVVLTRVPLVAAGPVYAVDPSGAIVWSNPAGVQGYQVYAFRIATTVSGEVWIGGPAVPAGTQEPATPRATRVHLHDGSLAQLTQFPGCVAFTSSEMTFLVSDLDGTMWFTQPCPKTVAVKQTDGSSIFKSIAVDGGYNGATAQCYVDPNGDPWVVSPYNDGSSGAELRRYSAVTRTLAETYPMPGLISGWSFGGVLLTLSRTRSSNMQTSAIEFVLRDEGRA